MFKLYGVNPDIALFGKALGNGYAITAIVGKREIMESAQNSFISSTFWTERIGYVAALATLKVMKETKSWQKITKTGKYIQNEWKRIAKKNELDIAINGIPALTNFSFRSNKSLHYKTYIVQEMLKKGFLSSNLIYVSLVHNHNVINKYIYELDKIFKNIKECEDGRDINKLLDGPVCHSHFNRID